MVERITISLDDDLAGRIDEQLDYGDNRSELLREWIREGLEREERSATVESSQTPEPKPDTASSDETASLPDSVPTTVDKSDARVAIDAAVAYVRDQGGATRADLVRDVLPDHSCGYDVPDDPSDYRGSWWRKIVRPALGDHEEIENPRPGGSEYTYR